MKSSAAARHRPDAASPALAGGLLYLRDDKEIVCLDVRKP